ncbi:MAG: helicase-related protein, partial [Burkholderiaceae bacterium]
INAMALHGNKSQAARTQALAGFKSGEIRALVATDIAARGIDIDDLPHVVNYEIPNISEDYVHRIGRTGRAGASGEAVNLVCMDEEGFMQDIERFTKQRIEVKVIEGFGPEPGEKAEPIAMGRQTIWGGLGKPPSREVMAAAAKAARTEMLQRVRERKANEQGAKGNGRHQGASQTQSTGEVPPDGQLAQAPREGSREGQRDGRPPRRDRDRRQRNGQGRNGPGNGGGHPRAQPPREASGQPNQPRHERANRGPRDDNEDGYERQPGPNAHLGSMRIREPRLKPSSGGQPDPLRTSIDSLGGRGGNRNRGGGGGGGRGGQRGDKGGPADPLRTSFGRLR